MPNEYASDINKLLFILAIRIVVAGPTYQGLVCGSVGNGN